MSALFLLLMVMVIVKSPIGKALADRLAGRVPAAGLNDADLDLLHQMDDRVLDLEERLEFAERLIQQQQERERLRAGE
ncbi:MAG: hypothetical protein IH876_05220 [Gemmatimonadetes bacterium]|nr:hypothetical protein [Gemmatimonadota bacterium]